MFNLNSLDGFRIPKAFLLGRNLNCLDQRGEKMVKENGVRWLRINTFVHFTEVSVEEGINYLLLHLTEGGL